MVAKAHMSPDGLLSSLAIIDCINTGLPSRIKNLYPDLTPYVRPTVSLPSVINPWW